MCLQFEIVMLGLGLGKWGSRERRGLNLSFLSKVLAYTHDICIVKDSPPSTGGNFPPIANNSYFWKGGHT